MTRDEAAEYLYRRFPRFEEIAGLAMDGDDYWTATVHQDGGAYDVSFPDWYPEGIAVVPV